MTAIAMFMMLFLALGAVGTATGTDEAEPQEPARPRKPFPWRSTIFKAFTIPVLGAFYIPMIALGIKKFSSDFGMPIWRANPFLEGLRNYVGLHRLEQAHVMAALLLIGSALLVSAGLKAIANFGEESGFGGVFIQKLKIVLGIVAMVADATCFYASLNDSGIWGATSVVSVSAVLLTAMYVLILLGWAVWSLSFEE
jgi:hypothetical protein